MWKVVSMRTAAVFLIVLSFLGKTNADDLPDGVVDTQNPGDVSLSPQESLARIAVPDGFRVTLFAGEPDLRRPIAFDFDDRGRLWVAENYSHPHWRQECTSDRILILEDVDHDGSFDRRKVFWDRGRYLTGMAVGHGGVWIGNTPEFSFIPDRDGDDVPDSEPVVMLDGFTKHPNNDLNNFHWGPDGWLYGAMGDSVPSHVGPPGAPRERRVRMTRGIWRFHPLHHTYEVVAEGMINPWGADFNEYGDLFTTNTVIAHLWHIVPGMKCQSRSGDRDHRYAYGLMQSITDHLHWGAGGGHAHCGAMIYFGDNWPEQYRGTLFTNNLHGNRVNSDHLFARKSTYVGVHSDDFLLGNDPWFRGLSIKYGPDGGVYVSDWHELGECHDGDGSHRSSGRIFKIVHGEPEKRTVDLQGLSDLELADLHLHRNEWFVRRARRILHERALSGRDLGAARRRLRELFDKDKDELNTLRALWTRFVIRDLDEAVLVRLLDHPGQHVRRWAIRFLVDREHPGPGALARMAEIARDDASPKVRLALACALQRLRPDRRWNVARALMAHGDDARDPYLPLLIWYGVEPLVPLDPAAALRLAAGAKMPLLRRFIARRALDREQAPIEEVVLAAERAPTDEVRADFLRGMLDALAEGGRRSAPPSWGRLYRRVSASDDSSLRSVAVRLATVFGDENAIAGLRTAALDEQRPGSERRDAFRALLELEDGAPVPLLHAVVKGSVLLRRDAIRALAVRNQDDTAGILLDRYADFDRTERQDAIGALSTRRGFVGALLTAIEGGVVEREEVSAFVLQQLRQFRDADLTKRIDALWKDDAQRLEKSDQIARYRRKMSPEYLKNGDASAGRLVFKQTCGECHVLFGEGNNVGPDLTGSGRREVDYILTNLIDPNATIDPAYRLTTVLTRQGQLFSGFIVYQDEQFVALRTRESRVRLALADITELRTSDMSMMPEGMLGGFRDEQVRDLLLYLGSPGQVELPGGGR
jgi:putative membrane-bound dehydrogenase-like protein